MPRASPALVSFNGGELSPTLEGRVDLAKYLSGCRIQENFLPTVQGPAVKRAGARFVKEVKASANFTRLIPFEFGTTQAYILEFGNLYMRVYRDGGIVLDGAGPAVFELVTPYTSAQVSAIAFVQSADVLYLDHPSHPPAKITRADHDDWTYTVIDFEWQPFSPENIDEDDGAAASAVTGTGITITSAGGHFTSDMVGGYFKLREIVGSNHGEWEPASNNASYNGTFSQGDTRYWQGNVYELVNSAVNTGTSPPIHKVGIETDGRDRWEYLHSGSGYVKITAVTDAYRATATVIKRLPASVVSTDKTITNATQANPVVVSITAHGFEDGDRVYIQAVGGMTEINQREFTVANKTANDFELEGEDGSGHTAYTTGGICVRVTHRWSLGAWSDENGYPRALAFHEDRLWHFGTSANPQTAWASRTGDYEDHEQTDEDESALVLTLNTDRVNVIEWAVSSDVLAVGTAGAEFVLSASAADEAITPGNVRATRRGTKGSKSAIQALQIGEAVLFVQRAGRKLREFVYDFDVDAYKSPDMTLLADHITLAQIKGMAFQQEPTPRLWTPLEDGQLLCFTYDREQEVTAWSKVILGGTSVVVESVASIPHPDGDRDQVWLIVKRTIDGSSVRYVEYFEQDWLRTNDQEDAFFVDSGLTYDGAAATTISGLDHLEGETVQVLTDGATHPDEIVASGQITLERSAQVVQVGLQYTATLQSMRLEAGARDGTAQGRIKRISRGVIRLDQTGAGFKYGVGTDKLDEFNIRDAADPMDGPVPLYDGDTHSFPWPGDYEREARVTVQHSLPLPCTVIGVFPQVDTNEA